MTADKNDKIQNIVNNNIYGNNNPVNIAAGHIVTQTDISFNIAPDFSELEKFGIEKEEINDIEKIYNENKNTPSDLKSKSLKWLGGVISSITARGLYDHIPAITEFINRLI